MFALAEYYLRNRACHLAKTCEDIAPRLEALRAGMTADRAQVIEWKAKANVKRPNLHELLLGGAITGTMPPQKADGLSVRQLLFGEDHHGDRFKSKSARDLMSEAEYKSYQDAQQALDWEQAGALLNVAFIREYPQFTRAKMISNCANEQDCRWWMIYALGAFPEYGFTRAEQKFTAADLELRKRTSPAPRFTRPSLSEDVATQDDVVLRRDDALGTMIVLARGWHVPALERLAALLQRGDVFNASEDVEFFILRRICEIDGGSYRRVAPRLKALRAKMASERAEAIDGKAKARFSENPNLLQMLYGERP